MTAQPLDYTPTEQSNVRKYPVNMKDGCPSGSDLYQESAPRAQELARLANAVLTPRDGHLPMMKSTRHRLARLGTKTSNRISSRLGLSHGNSATPALDVGAPDDTDAKVDHGVLPARLFLSSDCLTADVPADFCGLWLSRVLDDGATSTWRDWMPDEVIALADTTPRIERQGVFLKLYGRNKDLGSKLNAVCRMTGFTMNRVLDLSHYGYNQGWVEQIIKGRARDARVVAEDMLLLQFAELNTADSREESEWYTDDLKERAVLRALQHACGLVETDVRPLALAGAITATRLHRGPSLRGETATPDLTRYFWLRYIDSGVHVAHVMATPAGVPERAGLVDLRALAARDGVLGNDVNDSVADATGSGLNFVLAAYANRLHYAGTHVGLLLRGSLGLSIRHATNTGDIQPLISQVMGQVIHLWCPRYATASILEDLQFAHAPDGDSYVIDTSWPPEIECDPEIHHGYLDTLREYVAAGDSPKATSGIEAYYRLLDAAESCAGRCEMESRVRDCLYWLAVATECGQDALAWGAVSDLTIGRAICPESATSHDKLQNIRRCYEQFRL